MLKWPFFQFIKPKQTFVFEVPDPPKKAERRGKAYLHVGELISPPQVGPQPLFFPNAE